MTLAALTRWAGALAALATFSACGGSLAAPSRPGAETLTTAAHPNVSALPQPPAILPDRPTKSKTFEYVSDVYTGIGIFDYPTSDRQIGSIPNTGGGGCTNVLYGYGKKTFWIVGGYNEITEYAVLKKPIRSLSVSQGAPSGCAMDTSGDLAVAIVNTGEIVIFKNASGYGTAYTTPLSSAYFDGYDNKGNLFVDGFGGSGTELVELPKGSVTFEVIATSNKLEFPGSVQWDGKNLTVFDQDTSEIYRYTVSGKTLILKGTVSLSGASDCAGTWIAVGVVYCADAGNDEAEVFKYPAGGKAIALLEGNSDFPLGVIAAER
jgi:hypothetical protein